MTPTPTMKGNRFNPISPMTQMAVDRLLKGEWLCPSDFAKETGGPYTSVGGASEYLQRRGYKMAIKKSGNKKFFGVRSYPPEAEAPIVTEGEGATAGSGKDVVPFKWLDIPDTLPKVGQLVQIAGHLHSSTRGTILVLRSQDGHSWSVVVTDVHIPAES